MIIGQHKMGKSRREIIKNLKLVDRTVGMIIKKFEDTGTIADKKRTGRPRKTTKVEDRRIVIISKRNRRLTAPEIAAQINCSRQSPVSVTTVKERLHEVGLYGRVAVKKPLLRPQNKKKRLEWAKQHQNWTINQWNRMLWSDESKFEVFGSKRRVFVRRSAGERV
jgi:transposase